MALSVLARLVRRNAFQEFEQGLEGPRYNAKLPAVRGFTRGTLGATGVARPGAPATRNSNAGEQRDRQTLQGPIMNAFMGQGR